MKLYRNDDHTRFWVGMMLFLVLLMAALCSKLLHPQDSSLVYKWKKALVRATDSHESPGVRGKTINEMKEKMGYG